MTSCNGWKGKVRQQSKKTGKITGKSTQRQKSNRENQLNKWYILCIRHIGNEPQRPVTAKRVQPRKLVVTVVNNIQIASKEIHQMDTKTGKARCIDHYKSNSILIREARKEHVTVKAM